MFPVPFTHTSPSISRATLTQVIRRDSFLRFTLSPSGFSSFQPGQFVRLQGWEGEEPTYVGDLPKPGQTLPLSDPFLQSPYPLLGRSFSISLARLDETGTALLGFDLIVRVVGVATQHMEQYQEGREILIIGPLGKTGFTWNGNSEAILAGGGAGIAPLLPLAQALRRMDIPTQAFLGSRTEGEFPPSSRENLEKIGVELHLTTEDGSTGSKGLITDILEAPLGTPKDYEVYGCGPEGMLRSLCSLCDKHRKPLQVSLESMTACGIGACLGCAVLPKSDTQNHPLKVCIDGPVFQGSHLQWP